MNLEDSCFIEQSSKKVLISLHILDWERKYRLNSQFLFICILVLMLSNGALPQMLTVQAAARNAAVVTGIVTWSSMDGSREEIGIGP